MGRSVWVALAVLLVTVLLGALLLGRALTTTKTEKSLVPPGAALLAKHGGPGRRVVTWRRGGHPEDPTLGAYGVSIWEGSHKVYERQAGAGSVNIAVETGALILVFEDRDGSGGCGVYRALATGPGSVRQVLSRHLCEDHGTIHLRSGGLLTTVGARRDPKTAGYAHCCYLSVRRTLQRWNGSRLVTISSRTAPNAPNEPTPGGAAP